MEGRYQSGGPDISISGLGRMGHVWGSDEMTGDKLQSSLVVYNGSKSIPRRAGCLV